MKGAFSTPVCARKQTNGPPVIDQGFSTGSCNHHHALSGKAVAFLQAAATATMHCQAERWTHPPPPVPSFLLAQNLSSKRIAPTDNMWPKSDDAKRQNTTAHKSSHLMIFMRTDKVRLRQVKTDLAVTSLYMAVEFMTHK